MTATKQDIIIEQGADFDEPFIVTDASGNVVDITGIDAAMQIRTEFGAPDAIVTLTTTNGGLIVSGFAGSITPVIDHLVDESFVFGVGVYDLKARFPSGKVRRLREGTAEIRRQVTTIEIPVTPPTPPDVYGTPDGDVYGTPDGDQYGPLT